MQAVRDLMYEAIKLAGSEAKLGKLSHYSQHAIWRAKKNGRVSPVMALRIEAALNGAISAKQLCPEIQEAASLASRDAA